MQPLLLKAADAARLCNVSERTFHDLRHREGFPQPVTLGERAVRWRTRDIEAWVARMPSASDRSEPLQLLAGKRRARGEAAPA